MSRSTLKLVFAVALLLGVWSVPVPSEAVPKPLYPMCETFCCGISAKATSACKTSAGVVTTCGQWWQGHACP